MGMIFSILIAIIAVAVVIIILALAFGKKSPKSGSAAISGKTQSKIIKDANRRLAKNPHDPQGLIPMGEMYYTNSLWDKAYPIYDELSKLAVNHSEIDAFMVNLRCGVCALNLNKLPEAQQTLELAYKLDSHDYEINYYTGVLFYKLTQYDKAVPCFKKALVIKPDASGVNLMLGQSLYMGQHYHDCLPCFRKALTEEPSNKDALFGMADAMAQEGHGDKSIKVFTHLRPDPVYGARSCLQAGIYHYNLGDYDNAIQDFEIGLKHENIPIDTKLEIQYRYAQCFFAKNQFGKGLSLLKQIRSVNANYKDVNALVGRYQELSQNSNLQIYLSAGTGDFVALCRKIVALLYPKANIKFIDINVGPMYTDVIADVESNKWEGTSISRFFRTSGATGELYVRDFHAHMRDINADGGFCVTAGVFSDETHKFIEGRPVDLVEKTQLTRILKSITM